MRRRVTPSRHCLSGCLVIYGQWKTILAVYQKAKIKRVMLIGHDSCGLVKQFINMKVGWIINWKRVIYQTRAVCIGISSTLSVAIFKTIAKRSIYDRHLLVSKYKLLVRLATNNLRIASGKSCRLAVASAT